MLKRTRTIGYPRMADDFDLVDGKTYWVHASVGGPKGWGVTFRGAFSLDRSGQPYGDRLYFVGSLPGEWLVIRERDIWDIYEDRTPFVGLPDRDLVEPMHPPFVGIGGTLPAHVPGAYPHAQCCAKYGDDRK
jgi:hypothetical protein